MASTMMACPDPLMELEQAYLRNLSEAARLFRRDGRLELENDDGVLLVFEPAAMEPAVD
jgi:heat shock protein HslJ